MTQKQDEQGRVNIPDDISMELATQSAEPIIRELAVYHVGKKLQGANDD